MPNAEFSGDYLKHILPVLFDYQYDNVCKTHSHSLYLINQSSNNQREAAVTITGYQSHCCNCSLGTFRGRGLRHGAA